MADKPQMMPADALAALLTTTPEELAALARRGVIPKAEGGAYPQVRTIQAYTRHLREPLVSTTDAAAVMGKTSQWVRQLIALGHVKRRAGGRVTVIEALIGQIAFMSDENRRATKTAADSRVRDARAREFELKNAERERRLVNYAEHLADMDELVGMLRAELAGLPARVTRDLVFRRTIETAINDILARLADLAAEKAGDVAPGEPGALAAESPVA